jgi:hypothetical protein
MMEKKNIFKTFDECTMLSIFGVLIFSQFHLNRILSDSNETERILFHYLRNSSPNFLLT